MDYNYACIMNTEDGSVVKLTINDLRLAYREYRFLTKREYILENYPESEAAELGYEEFVNKYCKIEGMDALIAALDTLQQLNGVGHTTVGKYTVDTCSNGENYETAIWINPDRMAIPAFYPNRAAAEQGHKLWCVMAAAAPTQIWDTATNTYLTL